VNRLRSLAAASSLLLAAAAGCGERGTPPGGPPPEGLPAADSGAAPATLGRDGLDEAAARAPTRRARPLTSADVESFLATVADWRAARSQGPRAPGEALARHGYDATSWVELVGRLTALAALLEESGRAIPADLAADAEVLRPHLARVAAALR
jgi:hypothetical protein